jgi:NAD+ kinase
VNLQTSSIKKIGVLLRPSTPELKSSYYKLEKIFKQHNIDVYVDSISAGMIDAIGMEFEAMCQHVDAIVTLGGDGTLISAVRRSFKFGIPVLGVYAGNLGFLADVNLDELDEFVFKMTQNRVRVDERSVLEVKIVGKNKELETNAFNDMVLTRSSISNMIHIETLVDAKPFNTYYGDGVVVSTPTGSTAYNLSCGGPVIFPLTEVFALTPISAHSLSQRPVVLPGKFSIEMKTPQNKALVIIDGQDMHEIEQGDSVHIKLASTKAKLIHREEFNYFEILKQKLGWGDHR